MWVQREPKSAGHGPWLAVASLAAMGAGFAAELLRGSSQTLPAPWRWSDGRLTAIPARGWFSLLKAAFAEFNRDRIPAAAAGVAYYGVLALFPGLAAYVAFYGLFGNIDDARKVLVLLTGIAPPETLQFIGDEMVRIAAIHHAQLSVTFAVGVIVSIWSANAAVSALLGGLNVSCEQSEQRGLVLFTLGVACLHPRQRWCWRCRGVRRFSSWRRAPFISVRPQRLDRAFTAQMARSGGPGHGGAGGALPVRAKPATGALALGHARQRPGRDRLAWGFAAVLELRRRVRPL